MHHDHANEDLAVIQGVDARLGLQRVPTATSQVSEHLAVLLHRSAAEAVGRLHDLDDLCLSSSGRGEVPSREDVPVLVGLVVLQEGHGDVGEAHLNPQK